VLLMPWSPFKELRKGHCHVSTRPPGNLRIDSSYTIRDLAQKPIGHHQPIDRLYCHADLPSRRCEWSTSSWRRPAIFLFAVASRELLNSLFQPLIKRLRLRKRGERTQSSMKCIRLVCSPWTVEPSAAPWTACSLHNDDNARLVALALPQPT